MFVIVVISVTGANMCWLEGPRLGHGASPPGPGLCISILCIVDVHVHIYIYIYREREREREIYRGGERLRARRPLGSGHRGASGGAAAPPGALSIYLSICLSLSLYIYTYMYVYTYTIYIYLCMYTYLLRLIISDNLIW